MSDTTFHSSEQPHEQFIVGQRVTYLQPQITSPTTQPESIDDSTIETEANKREDDLINQQIDEPPVEELRLNAIIAAVHKDDFPNIYYTILLVDTNKEKQTVAQRLTESETLETARNRIAEELRAKQEEERLRLQERELLVQQQRAEILRKRQEATEQQQKNVAEAETPGNDTKKQKKEKDKSSKCVCS